MVTNMTTERVGTIKSRLVGFRWLQIREYLFNLSKYCDLEIIYLEEFPKIIRTSVYFKFRGTESNMNRFKSIIEETVRKYTQGPVV